MTIEKWGKPQPIIYIKVNNACKGLAHNWAVHSLNLVLPHSQTEVNIPLQRLKC